MLRHRTFVFKLDPDGETCSKFAQFCGCARFVYNKALAWDKECHDKDPNFRVTYPKMAALLPQWKKELPWLADCQAQVLQQALLDLMVAFRNFFEGRANFPKFHRKFDDGDSFRYPQHFHIDENGHQIYFPKVGWVHYHRSRFLVGTPKSITVRRKADGWYAAILTVCEVPDPVHPHEDEEVGIDVGVKKTGVLSNGRVYPPVNAFATYRKKLAQLQRRAKRMTKYSRNWHEEMAKISKLHKRIADIRHDHLQKITTEICHDFGVVYREDLNIRGMTASAKGTLEEPGTNVKQKSGLNRAILDQGWGMLFRMLDYKMADLGGKVYAVPARSTSQTCPICGHVSALNRLTQATFECTKCGFHANADYVAANIILDKGQRLRKSGQLQDTLTVQTQQRPKRLTLRKTLTALKQGTK